MYPITRILTLAAFAALIAASGAAHAGSTENPASTVPHEPVHTAVVQADLNLPPISECHEYRRAISRRACAVRLSHAAIGTDPNE